MRGLEMSSKIQKILEVHREMVMGKVREAGCSWECGKFKVVLFIYLFWHL